jgi:hypothetical protein
VRVTTVAARMELIRLIDSLVYIILFPKIDLTQISVSILLFFIPSNYSTIECILLASNNHQNRSAFASIYSIRRSDEQRRRCDVFKFNVSSSLLDHSSEEDQEEYFI